MIHCDHSGCKSFCDLKINTKTESYHKALTDRGWQVVCVPDGSTDCEFFCPAHHKADASISDDTTELPQPTGE